MSNYTPIEKRMPTSKKYNKLMYGLVIGGVFLFLIIFGGILIKLLNLNTAPTEPFSSGHENVAVIHVDGVIGNDEAFYNQKWIEEEISRAKFDRDNRAIVLKVNSPGGSAYASDETYLNLMDYKKETGRPIYAYAEQMMASGGYYIASASDEIYANRNSLVGSIGVIGFQAVDARELLDKFGVKITTIHSGKDKLMGSLSQGLTSEQIAFMQAMTDETYDQFVSIVAKARKMTKEEVKKLATGRIFTAKQSEKNGLINGIKRYDDFISYLEDKKDLKNMRFIDKSYERTESGFFNYLKYQATQSEFKDALMALDALKISEPQLLYQG